MTDWESYLDRFHEERAGITEELLERCAGPGGITPYRWLAEAYDVEGAVVDVGCGSGPMAGRCGRWAGLDRSHGELTRAQALGRGPLVMASSSALPIRTGRAAAVVVAMALMVVDDPDAMLREAARVLPPGAPLAVLVPARTPLTVADVARYSALLAALGRAQLPFPHAEVSRRLPERLAAAGFAVVADDSERFGYPTATAADADLLVRSLYLPGVGERRVRFAAGVARWWGRTTVGIPLRRILARRDGSEPC